MKRLIVFIAVVCACLPLCAQTTHQFGSLDSNNTWTGKNTFKQLVFCSQTVATLPANPSQYEMCWVTDGTSSSTCQAGGGTNSVLCYYFAGAWNPVPASGGGGGNTTSTGMVNGNFPVATGTNSLGDSGVSGTAFNGVSQLVQLRNDGLLPALNGSLLTNLANAPTSAVITQNSSGFLQGYSGFTFVNGTGVMSVPSLTATTTVTTPSISITGLANGCLNITGGEVGSTACPTGSGTVTTGTTAQFPEYPSNGTTVAPSLNLSETAFAGTAGLNYAGTGLSTFSGLLKATGLGTTSYTVSQLSAISGKFASFGVWVTDGMSLSDCTSGSGSTAHYCYYTGSSWIAGGGGSGTVNAGATGSFAFYGSNSPTVSPSTQLIEAGDTGSSGLTWGGSAGIFSVGGFTSQSITTDGILVLTKRGIGNFSLDAGTVATPYGWHAPTADAVGVLHSPGSGTPTAPSQLTLGPVTVADASTNVNGNGTKFQLFTGSAPTTNDCAKFDANGNVVDAGAACSSPGLTIQTNGVNNASQSALNITNSSTVNGSTFTATNTGTGVVQLGITGTLATPQGNGSKVQLSNGTATTGDCVKFDVNGNTVDAGLPCTSLSAGAATQVGVQNQSYVYATDTGSANAYAVALVPTVGTYTTGLALSFKAANSNTGASTIAVNGLSAIAIKKGAGSTALASGDITAGQIVRVVYDGTNFQCASCGTGGGSGTVTTTGSPASGNLTKFSGSSSITNGDLSGDVTTSGTLAATVVKVNGATVPASQTFVGTNSSGQIVAASTTVTSMVSATDIAPTSGDTILLLDPPVNATITRIVCGTSASTSAIVDVKPASESAWGTLGSSILSGTITAVPGGAAGTIASPSLTAHTPLMMVVGTVTGTVGQVYCAMEYTRGF